MDPLTLAIPTGRLFADTCALLQRVGWLAAVPTERTLVLPASDGRRVLIAKPADILTELAKIEGEIQQGMKELKELLK